MSIYIYMSMAHLKLSMLYLKVIKQQWTFFRQLIGLLLISDIFINQSFIMGSIVDSPNVSNSYSINLQPHSLENQHQQDQYQSIEPHLQLQNDLASVSMIKNKKQVIKDKLINKYRNNIQKCYDDLLGKRSLEKSIQFLKEQIERGQFVMDEEFKGVGCFQNWYGLHKEGMIGWLHFQGFHNRYYYNPYDLILLCFNQSLQLQRIDIAQVSQWYGSMIQKFSERYQLYFGIACINYNNKNFKQSLAQFEQALEIKNNSPRTLEHIAWIYNYWFDFEELAKKYAQQSFQLDPTSMSCEYILCLCESDKLKRYSLLKKLIEKYPHYYRIYINLGQSEEVQSISEQYYKKVLQFDQNFKLAYFKLGDIQRFNLRYEEAYKLYMKVSQIDKNEDYTYFYLGVLEQDKGNYDKAIDFYNQCLKMNPRNVDIYSAIASYYKNLYDTDKAFQFIHKQLQNNPFDYETCNLIGIYYDQENQAEKAITFFHKSVEINPSYFEPYLNLGSTYQEKKEYASAKNYYFKALELRPEESQVYYGIGICYGYTDQYGQAIKWCQKCIEKGGDEDRQVYEYIGDMYKHQKNYTLSLQYYLEYAHLTQQIHYEYILSNLIAQMDREQALTIIQENLTFYHENLFAMANLGKLLVYLEEEELATSVYAQLKQNNTTQCFKHRQISKEIQRFYGQTTFMRLKYSKGVISYSQKLLVSRLKRQFDAKYQSLFFQE